jgi:hypothetical protein
MTLAMFQKCDKVYDWYAYMRIGLYYGMRGGEQKNFCDIHFNWLPGDPLEIGAIGVLKDGRFRRESSLKELKIPCEESEAGYPQNLHYTSNSGVKISTSAEASAVETANAEVAIEFSQQGAFIFQAVRAALTRDR